MFIVSKRGPRVFFDEHAVPYLGPRQTITVTNFGYAMVWYQGRMRSLARLIMQAKPGEEVDHIDRNKMNNTRSNLRIATRAQNVSNIAGVRHRHDLPKGVHPNHSGYFATITCKGKKHYLGTYRTVQGAADAYKVAARRLHGEFKCFNTVTKF